MDVVSCYQGKSVNLLSMFTGRDGKQDRYNKKSMKGFLYFKVLIKS
jgi:hypothetical protein